MGLGRRVAHEELLGDLGATIIRIDNGAPFGGKGALGLSRLSVWWLRLGIAVEFIRRGHPQDNAAHEQMHRVLRAEVAKPPAPARPCAQKPAATQKPRTSLGPRMNSPSGVKAIELTVELAEERPLIAASMLSPQHVPHEILGNHLRLVLLIAVHGDHPVVSLLIGIPK